MLEIIKPQPRRPTSNMPIELKCDNTLVFAFDIDNTIIQFDEDGIVYTGFSPQRWQLFCQGLTILAKSQGYKVVFAIVTAKAIDSFQEQRAKSGIAVPIVNLQDYLDDNSKQHLDDTIGDILVQDVLKNLSQHIKLCDVFFSQGNDKSYALSLLAKKHNVAPQNIWMHDDLSSVMSKVKLTGFNGYLVPAEMYSKKFSRETREKACIKWMMQIFIIHNSPTYIELKDKHLKHKLIDKNQAALFEIYTKINESILTPSKIEAKLLAKEKFEEDFEELSLSDTEDTEDFVLVELPSPSTKKTVPASTPDQKIRDPKPLSPPLKKLDLDHLMKIMLSDFIIKAIGTPTDIGKAQLLLGLQGLALSESIIFCLKRNEIPKDAETRSQAHLKLFDTSIKCTKNSLLSCIAKTIIDNRQALELDEDSTMLNLARNRLGTFEI